jgi:hypothetical protein
MPLTPSARAAFDRVYASELVYRKDCWTLCGDAHCCHFTRHKARFRIMAQGRAFQELPLLPGEWEYLTERGWDRQFGEHELRTSAYEAGGSTFQVRSVISHREMCACDHATRTTICRLYPVLPRLDATGRLIGTDVIGAYEELERIDGAPSLCRLETMDISQLGVFLEMVAALADHPVLRVYLRSYEAAKRHVFDRLAERVAGTERSAFEAFETAFLRRRLFDHDALGAELGGILDAARALDGAAFDQEWAALHG